MGVDGSERYGSAWELSSFPMARLCPIPDEDVGRSLKNSWARWRDVLGVRLTRCGVIDWLTKASVAACCSFRAWVRSKRSDNKYSCYLIVPTSRALYSN